MSLLPQLLRLARQYHGAWMRPQLPLQTALRISAAGSGSGGRAAPAGPRHSSSATSSGGSSSSKPAGRSGGGSKVSASQPRRAVAASAGRRGNPFVEDRSEAPGRRKQQDDDGYVKEPTAAELFDSSRFNYDSDEDEEEEQQEQEQQQEQQQQEGGSMQPPSAQQQQQQEEASGGAQQQQRRRQRAGMPLAGAAAVAAAAEAAAAAAAGGVEEVVLPPPRAIKVKVAEFVKSSVTIDQCPPARHPEFAVIGRSNVGKSSLINMLTGRKALAMVSKTPGKTRCINHFIINNSWYLVDLPGYGYARRSKTDVVEWTQFTRQYFMERDTLVTVLLLVDASIPPMPLDIACAAWFADAEIPFTVVFTKLDKKKKDTSGSEENIAAFEEEMQQACGYLPPTILTSSKSGKGKNELLSHVAQLRDFYNKTNHGM